MPASPTSEYTAEVSPEVSPNLMPNSRATRSTWAMPTAPQLRAPTTTSTAAKTSRFFMVFLSYSRRPKPVRLSVASGVLILMTNALLRQKILREKTPLVTGATKAKSVLPGLQIVPRRSKTDDLFLSGLPRADAHHCRPVLGRPVGRTAPLAEVIGWR